MNDKGPSKPYFESPTVFFIVFVKDFIIQITTWNVILYNWHASLARNYSKLLVPFFLKIFSAPTSFSFFFYVAADESLKVNNKTLTAPLHLMNPS